MAGVAAIVTLVVFLVSPAQSQPSEIVRPSAMATRIDPSEAPTIDGDLSDPVWAKATVIDDFRQIEPNPGAPATERTELRILYDADNLYFAVYNYDSEPDKIVVRTMARDGPIFAEDQFRIFLDPNLTRRNGYSFEIGAGGGRTDALLENNTNDLPRWNTIWQVRTRIVADGWVSELAVPFRSLSFDPARTEWGLDFIRAIRRKEERVRWTSHNPSIIQFDISQSGTLTNIAGIRETLGLDIKVYGRVTAKHDWDDPRDAFSGATGANIYYKLTQGLTGTVTINPDFSDTPLDERLVNTTRFSLFIPESRDFFLQDAPAFEFGGRVFRERPNAQAFFSRNLGLINGTPVSILGGAKLSGTYEDIGIGALSVRTNDKGATDAQTLSVVRMTAPVLGASKVGFIFTNGDPTGLSENTLAGGDFQYHNPNFLPGKILDADVYYERSFSSTKGEDDSFGGLLNFPNEPWAAQFTFQQVGTNFAPALGFANRTGIRYYQGLIAQRTRYRHPFLRWLQFSAEGNFFTRLDNSLESSELTWQMNARSQRADDYNINVINYYENVPATFSLPRGVPVPIGEYRWTNIAPEVTLTRSRPTALTWRVECCSFYDGRYFKSDLALIFRPSAYLDLSPRYVATFIDLPTGYVDIHILALNGVINFTPDMQLLLQTQYDNISRSFGFSARYRWEYQPGNELFIALGQSGLIPDSRFEPGITQLSVRLSNTFRF